MCLAELEPRGAVTTKNRFKGAVLRAVEHNIALARCFKAPAALLRSVDCYALLFLKV